MVCWPRAWMVRGRSGNVGRRAHLVRFARPSWEDEMDIGKQTLKGWLVMLAMVVTLGPLVAVGAAQDGSAARDLAKNKTVYLPIAARMKPLTTLPFADGFGQDMSPHWTEYPFHGEDWAHDGERSRSAQRGSRTNRGRPTASDGGGAAITGPACPQGCGGSSCVCRSAVLVRSRS